VVEKLQQVPVAAWFFTGVAAACFTTTKPGIACFIDAFGVLSCADAVNIRKLAETKNKKLLFINIILSN